MSLFALAGLGADPVSDSELKVLVRDNLDFLAKTFATDEQLDKLTAGLKSMNLQLVQGGGNGYTAVESIPGAPAKLLENSNRLNPLLQKLSAKGYSLVAKPKEVTSPPVISAGSPAPPVNPNAPAWEQLLMTASGVVTGIAKAKAAKAQTKAAARAGRATPSFSSNPVGGATNWTTVALIGGGVLAAGALLYVLLRKKR